MTSGIRFAVCAAVVAAVVLVSFGAAQAYQAPVHRTLNYQGYLTSGSGQPVNGPVDMTFAIYGSATGGAALWTETQTGVPVTSGVYSVLLGSVSDFSTTLFDTGPLFLGVAVGTDPEMAPRQPLTSSAFSFHAFKADGLSGTSSISTQYPITSTVPTGQAPLEVSSTTMVPNLNADMVDGQHASDFVFRTGGSMTGPLQLDASAGAPLLYVTNTDTSEYGHGVTSVTSGGVALYGVAVNDYAIRARSYKANGTTLLAEVGSLNPGYASLAGEFKASDANSLAVRGTVLYNGPGEGYGLYGVTWTYEGAGVKGWAFNTLDTTAVGVIGEAAGAQGTGVKGLATATAGTGPRYGGYFSAAGTSGVGLYSTAPVSGNAGQFDGNVTVSGALTVGSISGNGAGLTNVASAANADTLDGKHAADFVAVTGDNMTGQLHIANNAPGYALVATNAFSTGMGVSAEASGTGDVMNTGINAVAAGQRGRAVFAWATATSGVNHAVFGKTSSPEGWAGWFEGRTRVVGDFSAAGTISGDGSGLWNVTAVNADTLDGLHAADFVPTAGGTMTGRLILDNSTDWSALNAFVSSPTASALYGSAWGSSGTGVEGIAEATGTNVMNYGVKGTALGDKGVGVAGIAYASTGVNIGVKGSTNSPSGYAGLFDGRTRVVGDLQVTGAITGDGSGLTGITATVAPQSPIVLEQSTAPSNTAEGRIQWDTDNDTLVVGTGAGTATFYPGQNTYTAGIGIDIVSNQISVAVPLTLSANNSGITGIVSATNTASDGYAVIGNATGTGTGTNHGGAFTAKSTTGFGVWGEATGTGGTGVYGYSSHPTGNTYGVRGRVDSANGYAGLFEGRVSITSTLTVNSTPAGSTSFTLCASATGGGIIQRCASTRRLKDNIQDLTFGLDVVKALRPVTFTWKENGNEDVGFIAEEVAEVQPVLAIYNEQGEPDGVKYANLTAVLVRAIQSQQAQIEELKAEIAALKSSRQ